jgi:aromatic-L-amino-acid/L-tryptophan decarboxylase
MSHDMPVEEFRAHAHALVDRVAELLEQRELRQVVPRVEPGEVAAALRPSSVKAAAMPEILREFEEVILPSLVQWNHPRFLGYFPNTGSYPAILAEILAVSLNVNAMSWESSPGGTELEQAATDLLRRMLGLPDPMFAEITDTASSGALYALAAAREFAEDLSAGERGLAGRDLPPLRVYCSAEAHSSVDKAAATLGFGYSGVARVGTDGAHRLDVAALRASIARDRSEGVRPLAVVATVGTTSTTAIDPVREIASVCSGEGLWLHVDSAYGGAAAVIPEMRWVLDGCELADSLVVNPHKWLFVPMDCSVLYCRRADMLSRAFTFTPAILRGRAGPSGDLMDYGVALGRRLRSLKLWFVLRYFGEEGLAARLREHIRLARLFASWVEADPRFDLLVPATFSTVVFRARGADADTLNRLILERVHASGEVFISHTSVSGAYALRVAVGNIRTEERDLAYAWTLITRALDTVA